MRNPGTPSPEHTDAAGRGGARESVVNTKLPGVADALITGPPGAALTQTFGMCVSTTKWLLESSGNHVR